MVVPDWTPEVAKSSERAPHDRLRSSRINCAQAFRRHCRLRTAHELIALAPVSVLCGFCRVARFSPTDRFSGRIDCFDATIPYGSEAVVIQLSETVTMLNWQYVRAASDLDPENDVSPSGDAAVNAPHSQDSHGGNRNAIPSLCEFKACGSHRRSRRDPAGASEARLHSRRDVSRCRRAGGGRRAITLRQRRAHTNRDHHATKGRYRFRSCPAGTLVPGGGTARDDV